MIPNAAKSGFTLDELTRMGPDEIAQKRKIAEALLAQSQGIHQIRSPMEGMAQLAQALIGNLKGAYLDRKEREGKAGADSLFSAGMGMGEFPAAPGGSASAPSMDRYAGMADGPKGQEEYHPGDDYFANIRAAESGGSDSAKNPNSSATGRYQFIGSTWDGLRRSHPELGLTAEGRMDPNQQERAIRAFTADNAKELSSAGIPLTGGNLYAAHFLGSGGARKVLSADPGASVASIVGSGVVNANPFLRNMTVADFSRWAARKGGSQVVNLGQPAAAAPVQVASLDPSIGIPPAAGAAPPQNQAALGQALIEQGIDPNGPQAQAFASIGAGGNPPVKPPPGAPVDPAQAAASNGIVDLGPGKPGEIRKGPDGRQYQYVETTGMAGANGPQGWIPVNEAAPAAQVPIPAPPATGTPVAPVGQGQIPPNQVQLAQALTGGQPDIGLTMGVTPHAPGEGPSLQTLMGMMSSPDAAYMSPQQQKLIEALTGQRMEQAAKQSDPAYQMDMEAKRLQLDKLRKGDPGEALDLERKRLELDKLRRGDPSEALDLQLKEAQLKKLQTGDPKDALELEKLRLEIDEAKGGGKADYKVVNNRLIKTQGDKVEDVTPAGPGGKPQANFDDVSGVRKEIVQLPSYKNLSQAVPIYKSMVETAGRDNKASDLNLVYGLGKIMDPTSVVREGELHMANDTQGMADYLNGIIKGIQGEGRLSPEARAQIMTEAYGRVKAYQDVFGVDTQMYRGIAERSGMNVEDVLPNLGEGLSPWVPATPPATVNPATPAAPPAAAVPGSPRKTKNGVTWSVQ